MSWLSSLTSAENAAALFKQAVSHVESKIDQVLDIPQGPNQNANTRQQHEADASRVSPRSSTGFRALRDLSASLTTGLQAVNADSTPRSSRHPSETSPQTSVHSTTSELPPNAQRSAPLDSSEIAEALNKAEKEGTETPSLTVDENAQQMESEIPTTIAFGEDPDKSTEGVVDNDSTMNDALETPEDQKLIMEKETVATSHKTDGPLSDPAEGKGMVAEELASSSENIVPRIQESAIHKDTDLQTETIGPASVIEDVASVIPPIDLTSTLSEPLSPSDETEDHAPGAASPKSNRTDLPSSADDSKELARLRAIIEQREQQLMKTMQENATLTDTLTSLKTQLEQSEAQRNVEATAADDKIRDLTERLNSLERQQSATSQTSVNEALLKLQQKEEMITQLMAEGEKLSKAELKANTTIKRLRTEKIDIEKQMKDVTTKLGQTNLEVTGLKSKLAEQADNEKKQTEMIRSLKEVNERQTKEITRLQTELATAREQQTEVQSALDRVKSEFDEAQKAHREATSAVESQALDIQVRLNNDLRSELETVKRDAEVLQQSLTKDVHDLRMTLAQREEDAGWKEDMLRRDIDILQQKLQAAEARNNEFYASGQDATLPLLRQIDALQSQHNSALRKWEQLERSLTMRIHEAEQQRDTATSKENNFQSRIDKLLLRIQELEGQVRSGIEETARLSRQLEAKEKRISELQPQISSLETKCTQLDAKYAQSLQDATKLEENFRKRLEEERLKWEERYRLEQKQVENIKDERPSLRVEIPPPQSQTGISTPRQNSASFIGGEFRTSDTSLGASMNTAAVIDRLHASVKHYEGQLGSLQLQLHLAEEGRNELAEELVRLTAEHEEMTKLCAELRALAKEKEDLNTRYLAALELLGEKTERVEELQADILDMKELFKQQVTDLVAELDELRRSSQRK
ncbi:uncharacterized protein SPPG_01868 [Spizellomyces punctatus DAOM BR117]|uniref:TATA element modulatory factor 1 TATA binding domain-containing protein n=1 Tax=Spizellomyces punctatus (strain DAOM BR117) TaxID=645134 RepID=A0A0L0HMZ0_SPIPD|nr:uncharacterized protein SPPG_01868 [Spizellomyces punctatus DAOM BR117]KND02786.1 hypothetical protein SPPG_01868 [Spizellomyces punctatus DAOM BR117]|eukprot:XP_016610825.1 hypothetical protein SPPG_01868 [Spizellomyces punctatus DAOM BR117]